MLIKPWSLITKMVALNGLLETHVTPPLIAGEPVSDTTRLTSSTLRLNELEVATIPRSSVKLAWYEKVIRKLFCGIA